MKRETSQNATSQSLSGEDQGFRVGPQMFLKLAFLNLARDRCGMLKHRWKRNRGVFYFRLNKQTEEYFREYFWTVLGKIFNDIALCCAFEPLKLNYTMTSHEFADLGGLR